MTLTTQDIRWVTKWAQRYGRVKRLSVHDTDDLTQDALLELVKCAARYSPDLGKSFRAFACKRIAGSFVDSARENLGRGSGGRPKGTLRNEFALESIHENPHPDWRAPPKRQHRTVGPRQGQKGQA